MYETPHDISVERIDPRYRWSYVASRLGDYVYKSLQKFRCIDRYGVPQSDWVSGSPWGSPVVAIAPPKGALQCPAT